MPTIQLMKYCSNCGRNTLHVQQKQGTATNLVHIILVVMTLGLWLVLWALAQPIRAMTEPPKCTVCGKSSRGFSIPGAERASQKEESATAEERVPCPFCAEMIRPEAHVCRFCHRDLPEQETSAEEQASADQQGGLPSDSHESDQPKGQITLSQSNSFLDNAPWAVPVVFVTFWIALLAFLAIDFFNNENGAPPSDVAAQQAEDSSEKLVTRQIATKSTELVTVVDRANVRQSPTTNSTIIGKLNRGDRVVEISRAGDWLRIEYASNPSKTGYVFSGLLGSAEKTDSGALGSVASINQAGFLSFDQERKRITRAIQCRQSKVTPPSFGLGYLYGCISGSAETVKVFVNEAAGTGNVENVKIMWNDWFRDGGWGVHADRTEARRIAETVLNLYDPAQSERLLKAFFASSDTTVSGSAHRFKYTYRRGPKIDERLLVITPK